MLLSPLGSRTSLSPQTAAYRTPVEADRLGFPPLVQRLRELFAVRGVSVFVVGGTLRDALLRRPIVDVDLAVEGDAFSAGREIASAMNGRLVVLDDARDICRVHIPGDEHWQVDLAGAGDGIVAHLLGRDFTVDAMAVPLADVGPQGGFPDSIDPSGGVADLQARVIRAVSGETFRADPARLMRAARLAVQLGFDIEPSTEDMVQREASLVNTVSAERVRDELLLLLEQPGATEAVRLLDRLHLLGKVVPEIEEARNVTQPKEHHWDVFNHLVETAGQVETVLGGPCGDDFVSRAVPRPESLDGYFDREVSDGHTLATLIKLGGLLHDVAKPATRTVEQYGRIRFLGHHSVGAEMVQGILERLRLSRRGTDLLSAMVQNHLRPAQMAPKGEMPSGRAVYRFFRDVGEAAIPTLYLNLADYIAARGPDLQEGEWADYCDLVGFILEKGLTEKATQALPKLVDGRDIIDAFALSPGPQIGELLDVAREAQAGGEVETKVEALDLIRMHLDAGGRSA